MPSVTLTTVPTLRASASPSNFSMRCLMSWLISEGLRFMFESCYFKIGLMDQGGGEERELLPHRAVDDQVAGADHCAADERLVFHVLERDLAAELLVQRLADE